MSGTLVPGSGRLAGSGMCVDRRLPAEEQDEEGRGGGAGGQGAYAGRVGSLLKQGGARWEPDGGASEVVQDGELDLAGAAKLGAGGDF